MFQSQVTPVNQSCVTHKFLVLDATAIQTFFHFVIILQDFRVTKKKIEERQKVLRLENCLGSTRSRGRALYVMTLGENSPSKLKFEVCLSQAFYYFLSKRRMRTRPMNDESPKKNGRCPLASLEQEVENTDETNESVCSIFRGAIRHF